GHASSVLCCKFVNKGMQIVSGASDGVLKYWNLRTGECVQTYEQQHNDRIWCIATVNDHYINSLNANTSSSPTAEDGSSVDVSPSSADLVPLDKVLITGGTDACINLWVDVTQEKVEEQVQL